MQEHDARRPMTTQEDVTLSQLQAAVDAIISPWGYWSPLANLARLTEEVGELAREINHAHGPKAKKASEAPGRVEEELADVLFVVLTLANSMNIDLTAALERVLTKVQVRDAGRWTPRRAQPPAAPPAGDEAPDGAAEQAPASLEPS